MTSILPARFALYHCLVFDAQLSTTAAGALLGRDPGTVNNGIRQLIDWASVDRRVARDWMAFRSLLTLSHTPTLT